MVILIESTIIL